MSRPLLPICQSNCRESPQTLVVIECLFLVAHLQSWSRAYKWPEKTPKPPLLIPEVDPYRTENPNHSVRKLPDESFLPIIRQSSF